MKPRKVIQRKLTPLQSLLLGIVIGLLVGYWGPSLLGWQTSSDVAQQNVRDAVLQQQVNFCVASARAAVADPSKQENSARYELAKKMAKMPWEDTTNNDVFTACYNKLSQAK
ncbi:MAG: hypothetical protein HY423_03960 [Candidatus Lambdaproteobacteria bacterium]|nr:hypothetical protein [Candidatus Lambdaproteobacteria bacterium]